MPENPQRLGLGLSSFENPVPPTPAYDQAVARDKRRQDSSVLDYAGSMYRSDSFVPGLMAELAGNNTLKPDPAYNVFKDPELDNLSKGIPDHLLPYLWQSHSAAHAIYTADRLRQKVEDEQRLDEMGTLGNIGRFGLGFVAPENLLSMGTGFVVGRGVQAARIASAARGASGVGRAAAVAEVNAAAVAGASTKKAIGIATGLGAAENYAQEAIRQSVSFEDSEAQRLTAGIMGGLFTLPLAALGARSAGRLASAADDEANALRALADASEGKQLTPVQIETIQRVHTQARAVEELESGKLTQEEFLQRLESTPAASRPSPVDNELVGPVEPDEMFLGRLQERTREQANEIIAKYHGDGYEARQRMKRQERAFRVEAMKEERAKARRLRLEAEQQGFTLADLQDAPAPANSALADGLRKAFGVDDPAEALRRKETRKVVEAETKAARKDAWAAAEAAQAAQRKAEEERAYIERELALSDDASLFQPKAPEPAPVEAPKAPEEAVVPEAPPVDATPAPTARAPEDDFLDNLVGEEVSWLDPKTHNVVVGTVSKVNRYENGIRAVVDTDSGPRSVDPKALDQWPQEAPSGFLPGSIGAAQALPIQFLEDVAPLSSRFTGYSTVPGTNGKVKIPLRFDLFAFLNESENPMVRSIANALIRDPVGFKDKTRVQYMTASEWRDHIRRTVGGEYHLTAREAAREAMKAAQVPFWDKLRFNAQFYEAATIVARGDMSVLTNFPPAAHGAIKKAASAQQAAMAKMLEHLKHAGVEGADQINPNSAYVSRVWRHDKIRQAIATHGEDAVVDLLAGSFYGMGKTGPLTGNTEKARAFLNTIQNLEFSTALQDVHLAARDMGVLREELKQHNLTDSEIDALVDVMFESKAMGDAQAGKPGNLKARMSIDETAFVQTQAGRLSIHDLVENDARVIVDRYLQTMGGHYGMARAGFPSTSAFRAKLKEAIDDHKANNRGDRFKQELQWLQDINAHITGRPMSMADYSGTARFASAFRGYTRSVTLGQLGLTAAFELKQAVGVMGMQAFIKQMPSFRGFLSALRNGYLPDPGLSRQVLQISGHGAEMASAYARAREISEDLPAHILGSAEHWANRVSHAADVVSGNASITSFTRQLSAKMSIQFLHDLGDSASRLTPEVKARLAGHGLGEFMAPDVIAHLRKYANARDGTVQDLRLDDWLREEPDTYEAFQVFVGRQVRDAIQDHDLGETMPFMHSTLGKVFAELKTFFLVAHAKNMLKNVHYADGTTMSVLMTGMVGEALTYAIQQAINAPDKLNERLSPEVMGPAVIARMGALGFAPMLIDTGYQLATGESLLAQGSTSSGTNNRNLLSTPSFQTFQALYNLPGIGLQTALGTDPLTGADIRSVARVVPLANSYGARGLVNYLAEAQ